MRGYLLLIVSLLAVPSLASADTEPPAARIRQDAQTTGQAFKRAGREVGHDAVRAYRKNRGTFKRIGHAVQAQGPVLRHQLHEADRRNAWVTNDYHRSVSWIKQSARTTWRHARETWYQVTGAGSPGKSGH